MFVNVTDPSVYNSVICRQRGPTAKRTQPVPSIIINKLIKFPLGVKYRSIVTALTFLALVQGSHHSFELLLSTDLVQAPIIVHT